MWNLMGHCLKPLLAGTAAIAPKHGPLPVVLPKGFPPMPATSQADMDAALQQLQAHKATWVHTPPAQRVRLLDRCMWNLIDKAHQMAELGQQAKGSYSQGLGEELVNSWLVVLAIKEYCLSLKAGGQRAPKAVYPAPGGPADQLVAEVFPWGMLGALLPGAKGQVWLAPGKPASQGAVYRDKAAGKASAGAVSLVLGAGNQWPVVVLDILHKLVAEDEVVCAKMSPVNEYLGPVLAEALQPLVDAGALRIVYGAKEVGEYLVSHPLVDSIHLTGSADTCNAIIWGDKDAPRTGTPKLSKRITAELGNVTPYVVVPGPWSEEDIRSQVKGIVLGLTHNAAHNCLAAEVVITAADWPLRDKFLTELRNQLAQCPRRAAYYPGSQAKYDDFKARLSGTNKAQELGTPPPADMARPGGPPVLPWLLVDSLTPEQVQGRQENWCGVLQEVALPGLGGAAPTTSDYLEAAGKFVAGGRMWGSLACSVICHPDSQKQDPAAWNQFIAGLRYGSVCINCPAAMGFAITALPWGAAPGNSLQDVESGIGVVHNTFLFDHAVKGVLEFPWRQVPKPLYFPDNYAIPFLAPPLLRMTAYLDAPLLGLYFMTLVAAQAVRA